MHLNYEMTGIKYMFYDINERWAYENGFVAFFFTIHKPWFYYVQYSYDLYPQRNYDYWCIEIDFIFLYANTLRLKMHSVTI